METFEPRDLNSRESVEGRKKGFSTYRKLALMYFVVGGGLLATGILGVKNISEEAKGPPYYIGGFVGGSLALINCVMCIRILSKEHYRMSNDIEKNELKSVVLGQQIFNLLSFMGIFFGLMMAFVSFMINSMDISGFDDNERTRFSWEDEVEVEEPTDEFDINDPIQYGMFGGLAAMVVVNVISGCNVTHTGSYFGVEHKHVRYMTQEIQAQQLMIAQQSLALQQQQQQQLGGQQIPGQPMLLPGQFGMPQSLGLHQPLPTQQQQQLAGQQLTGQPMLLPGQVGIQQPQPLIRPPPPSYNTVGSGF